MTTMHRTLRRLAAETRAAEIAEAAAVLPLMFMILLGIFWFGQAFSLYGTITRAAQEGARAGAAPVCTTCTASATTAAQNAVSAVQAALTIAKLDPSQVQFPSSPPVLNACPVGGQVACDNGGSSTNVCVQTPVQISSLVSSSGACEISVSFQYPFQFWLPFTSLNKQIILIPASARVRLENQ